MNRREFLAAGSALAVARPAPPRPNIIMVVGDDLTWRCTEPYGSREVRTPNMTRLAGEGVTFDNMFAPTAMCAPVRQAIYTGMYPVRNGGFPNHSWVYEGVRSLPHHFRALGYRVGLTGKRHFGSPASFPFELLSPPEDDPDPQDMRDAARFIERDRRQPYFLVVASNQPHVPLDKGDPSQYPPGRLTVPPDLVDCPHTRQWLSKYYAEITYLDQVLGKALDLVESSGRRDNTIVMFVSEQGSQLPFSKWTCYDAGLHAGFIVRWPGHVRPGTRRSAMAEYVDLVPTLLEAAGTDPRRIRTGRPDAHGNRGFDGRSFLPVLVGERDTHRDYVFGVQTTRGIISGSPCYPVRSVRSRRFKYIRNLKPDADFASVITTGPNQHIPQWLAWGKTHPEAAARAQAFIRRPAEEFYDLETDPYELRNIATAPAHAEVKASLGRQLQIWMDQQGDRGIETEMQADSRKPPQGADSEA